MNDTQKRMLHAKAIAFKTSGQQQRVGMDWIESFLGNAHIDSDNEDWNESVDSVFDSDSDSDESELVISDDESELVISDDESELVISDEEDVLDSDDEREGSDRDEDCCPRYHYGGQFGCDLCIRCADVDNPEIEKEWLKDGKYCYRLHKNSCKN